MQESTSIKQKVVGGFFWLLSENFCSKFVGFAISLVLARLLCPAVYGIIALTTVFISISNFLIDSGFAASLIQKKNVEHIDFDSVFYFNVVTSLLLYGVLFVSAPAIARFYHEPQLILVLRTLSVTLVINAVNAVQNAELARQMLFRIRFRLTLTKCVLQGCVGIAMAYLGYGVWALVIAEIFGSAILVAATWFWVGWRPHLAFSFKALRGLFQFGWKIFASGIWGMIYNNVYGVLVGRFYTPTDLGLYNKGNVFPNTAMSAVQSSVYSVVFPAFSKIQDSPERLLAMTRRLVRVFTFFTMPLLAILAGCADPLIHVLLGDKWVKAIPYLQIGCLVYACFPLSTVPTQALKAIGRSDLLLYQVIIGGVTVLLAIGLACTSGAVVMAGAVAVATGPVDRIIAAVFNRRYLAYRLGDQIRDIFSSCVLACLIFGSLILALQSLHGIPQVLSLLILGVLGVLISVFYCLVFRPLPFLELLREPKVQSIVEKVILWKPLWSALQKD